MSTSSDQNPVELLADEFLARHKRGEKPTIGEYCERHPDLAEEIRDVFEALLMVEDLKPGSEEVSGSPGDSVRIEGKRQERIGDYRLLREIGRGGMGVVYEAEQEALARRVALKVLPKTLAGDSKALIRFQREARATARMHHTNIVPVFDVGQDGDCVFYAMQLIHGQGLDLVIEDLKRLRDQSTKASQSQQDVEEKSIAASLLQGQFEQENLVQRESADSVETTGYEGSLPTSAVLPGQSELSGVESNRQAYYRSVAQIGLQTAGALSYAHARGIIHRDIKPGNLLLDAGGNVWVTDFGLAKTSEGGMTHTGDILGTIRYMAPERFRGQCDVRADVYALGLTLYELLVLKPAYASSDRLKLIEQIRHAEPPGPRSQDPHIPRDLETIVLKSIDKDAKRRYQSADELTEDLQRFLEDRPIKARRISVFERFARWSRRNKSLAASLSIVAVLVTVLAIGSTIAAGYFRNLNAELNTSLDDLERARVQIEAKAELAQKNQALADERAEEIRQVLYAAEMRGAYDSLQSPFEKNRAKTALDHWPPREGEKDLRGWEWYFLRSLIDANQTRLQANGFHVDWSPDGKRVVYTGSRSQTVHDTSSGLLLRQFSIKTTNDGETWLREVQWSPDGNLIAAGRKDRPGKTIYVWEADSGRLRFELAGSQDVDGNQGGRYAMSWNSRGTHLAAGSPGKGILIWDMANGKQVRKLNSPSDAGHIVATRWRKNDTELASVTSNGTIRIWNPTTGKLQQEKQTGVKGYRWCWSRDGMRLAGTHPITRTAHVWNLAAENLNPRVLDCSPFYYEYTHSRTPMDFSPDGKLLAIASWSHNVTVWNVETSQLVAVFPHLHQATSVRWSPDGKRLATTEFANQAVIWKVPAPTQGPQGRLFDGFTWSGDGRYLLTHMGKTVSIWESGDWSLARTLPDFSTAVQHMVANPSSPEVTCTTADGTISTWSIATGQRVEQLHPELLPGLHLCCTPTGRVFCHASRTALTLWSSSDGTILFKRGMDSWYYNYKMSSLHPREELVAVAGFGGHRVWNYRIGKLLYEDDTLNNFAAVAWNSDGTRLALGAGKSFRVLDYQGEQFVKSPAFARNFVAHGGNITSIQWNKDSNRILTTGLDQSLRVWHAENGHELLRVEDVTTAVPCPLGLRVAVMKSNGLQILDASPAYAGSGR